MMFSRRGIAKPGALSAAAVGLLGIFIATAVTVMDWALDEPSRHIERTQAEDLLSRAAVLAQAGNSTGLCQTVAATSATCRSLLDYTESKGWEAGADPPRVVDTRRYPKTSHTSETLVLRVAGVRADGSHYESDFPVIRTPEGEIRSTAPVYWSGVVFDESQIECNQADGDACAQDIISPP
ncbi:hypothetical protein O7608_03350 [Solwaraspora sp. WMMA2056]|uniref:hypothetical protein n=1 Tax=Solwaraspora sp. WMMA2056 TaxID=3015161 RepID=UPI00259B0FFA|nr:hypothetical protein [Solwaraspora sp. WMMA2056]WJK41484.1 hypothetical protein O7608_03350 [Solwaraspora sp. WMMA2056]